MPTLLVYYPDKEKRWTLQVPADHFVIGRSHEADVCIPLPSISKKHIILQRKGPRFLFKDLESKNGVYINGFRQDHGSVVDGDEIRLGSVLVTFYREKPPQKEPSLPTDPKEPTGTLAEILAVDLGDEELTSGSGALDPRRVEDAETSVLAGAKPSPAASQPTSPAASQPAPQAVSPPGRAVAAEAEAPREPEEAGKLSLPLHPEPAKNGDSEREAETKAPEHTVPRPVSAHVGRKASRMPPASWRLPAPALLLAMVFCAGIGFLLGHVSSYLDTSKGRARNSVRPAGSNAAGAQASGQAAVESTPAAAKTPQNPLGPRASLEDPLGARRLVLRLYLDIAGRPPTRDELKDALSLSLENVWVKADSKRAAPFDPPEKEIEDSFPRFLGRAASASEKAAILDLARGDPKYFAFHVATSEAYASAKHRRKRTPEQLARSLLTDLLDIAPSEADARQTLEALKASKKGFEDPARVIVQSKRADAGPRAGESGESWLKEAYARFLQRFPTPEEEKGALAELKSGGDGWRRVLLGLATRDEYKDY